MSFFKNMWKLIFIVFSFGIFIFIILPIWFGLLLIVIAKSSFWLWAFFILVSISLLGSMLNPILEKINDKIENEN